MDFYDDQGLLIRTERNSTRRTATADDVMNLGTDVVLNVARPAEAKTYRIRLIQ